MESGQRPVGAKPRQNLPESKKNEDWYRRNVYYYLGLFYNAQNITQRTLMERNWRIYTGNLDTSEFNYLLYPEGTQDPTLTVQAVFKNYQLAQPLIQSRINQFLSAKLSYSVDITNREAVLSKQERMASIMAEKIAKREMAALSAETGVPIDVEDLSIGLPDDLQKLQSMSIREIEEDAILNGLKYCENKYDYKSRFAKALEYFLVMNSALFRNRRIHNDPVPDVINPLDTALFMQTDDDKANWGDGFITVTWKSVADIMDNHELTDEQTNLLEKLTSMSMSDFQKMFPLQGGGWYDGYGYDSFYRNIGQDNAKVLVAETQWRSLNHMYIKKGKNMYDPDSYFYKKLSEEEYNEKSQFDKKNYKKIPYYDLRQATLVGHQTLLDWGRVKFQTRREEYGYGRVPLQITGIQKNPLQAVMTILSPLQIEYSIAWFHIERLLGQAGGKMIELWLHNKPTGWDNAKWIFYAKQKGVNIREYKEGDENKPMPSISQGVDLGMSSSLQYLIQYVLLIENTAQKLIGTNAAAQGSLTGQEAVGVTQANLMQAQNMVAGIYYDLNRAIEQQLNDAADKMKMWWKKGETKVWQTDVEKISFTVLSDLSNNDYGVFVKNNALDEQKMMKYEALANQALASGGAEYLDFIMEMMGAENSSEAKAIIKKGMGAIRQQQQQFQQQQIAVQQQLAQTQAEANQLKQQELQVKAQTPIAVQEKANEGKIIVKKMEIEHEENVSEVEGNQENERMAFEQGMEVVKNNNGQNNK